MIGRWVKDLFQKKTDLFLQNSLFLKKTLLFLQQKLFGVKKKHCFQKTENHGKKYCFQTAKILFLGFVSRKKTQLFLEKKQLICCRIKSQFVFVVVVFVSCFFCFFSNWFFLKKNIMFSKHFFFKFQNLKNLRFSYVWPQGEGFGTFRPPIRIMHAKILPWDTS